MKEPSWLGMKLILALQNESIVKFGGSPGLRDRGLLESALARPQHLFFYGEPSLFELAAGYGYGISRNHPFIDGNKRIAFLASAVFLMDNGYMPQAEEVDVVNIMRGVAAGELEENELATWLERNFTPK